MEQLPLVNVKTVYKALGLKFDNRRHKNALICTDAIRLHEAVTAMLPQIALPISHDDARVKMLQPQYLDQEVEKLFRDFSYIWGRGTRRCSVGNLFADTPQDVER